MTKTSLPILGVSTTVKALPSMLDWVLDKQRDLELQDPSFTPMFDNDWSHIDPRFVPDTIMLADWREVAKQANTLLDGYTGRLSIHGPFVGMPLLSVDKLIRDAVKLRFRQSLEFAQVVGATQMVIHSPWEFFGGPWVPNGTADSREVVIGTVHAMLDDILPLAEKANCVLVIEDIFDKNPTPLLELIRSFESDYVRLSIDVGHAQLMHLRGGPTPDQWVRAGADLLTHTHIQDNDGESDRHWGPGRGHINWFALFEAFKDMPDYPRLILETRDYAFGAAHLAGMGLAQ